jgi:ABC-type antimicrobial peptide transport system permease subunit
LGLAVVMLRNVEERRGEIALLRAVGYDRWDLSQVLMAEVLTLLGIGVALGGGAALLAVAPTLVSDPSSIPWISLSLTLAAVLGSGLLGAIIALGFAVRARLMQALRGQ